MKWPNVKLIFARELRDQLRDRRTLFTVAIMPMILYPLMGMAMLQVAQFMREYPTEIMVIGAENLPDEPALIIDGKINRELVSDSDNQLMNLIVSEKVDGDYFGVVKQLREQEQSAKFPELVDQLIQSEMRAHGADVAVFIPTPILPADKNQPDEIVSTPGVYVFQNSASDKSRMGSDRFSKALQAWNSAIIHQSLTDNSIPLSLVRGVQVSHTDVADKVGKRAAAWSKILPFIIMIWSLTGAFYPAIDLCAGEKERGTFETLLSSPAARSEIAIGKLLTVMTFSMVTSLLNLLSMGFTGMFVVARLGSGTGMGGIPIGAPPIASIGWLILALIPISALFSAVALAAAAFARSSKEGQYYLVPMMMISMPLMMIPMLPAAQLDFGTSLIPVSGLMLLLRGLMEGQYAECLKFVSPVCAVTLICCWAAVRWVIHQFNSETVMFRASERFGIGTWCRHVMRERDNLPTFGSAIMCGVIILVAKFFIGFVVTTPENFFDFAKTTVIILVATIAVPAVIMAMVLTRDPLKSLRIRRCSIPMACAAVLAAIFLNPMMTWFTALVMKVYPPGNDLVQLESVVSNILGSAPGLWAVLLVFAVAPAILEEIAFRGFILSGMEALRNKWQAIFLTSLLFGIAHGVIQQTMITFGVGMILGVIAIQTRSIWPCVLFHLTHNCLAVMLSKAEASVVEGSPILGKILFSDDGQLYQYGIFPGAMMSIVGVMLLLWFLRLDTNLSDTAESKLAKILSGWSNPIKAKAQ
ncbi:MAG: ABC transporter permease subunit/CPBP intramembrane protease [Mariniblastus sp.]